MKNSKKEEEEEYLCQLYGDDCRFVKFINNTGRAVRLSSELKMVNYDHMRWTSNVVIPACDSYSWRFLGESQDLSSPYLSLLPDPYTLAITNKYSWSCSYLDSESEEQVLIADKVNKLELKDMAEIPLNGTTQILIETVNKEPATLKSLTFDQLVRHSSQMNVKNLDIPTQLKLKLFSLLRDYAELRNQDPSCPRCTEIHP